MMEITSNQIAMLSQAEENKFIEKSLVFLQYNFPEWSERKNEMDLKTFVNDAIALGKKYNILEERSIQKIMYFIIYFQMPSSLPNQLAAVLREDASEEAKIKNLYKALAKAQKPNSKNQQN